MSLIVLVALRNGLIMRPRSLIASVKGSSRTSSERNTGKANILCRQAISRYFLRRKWKSSMFTQTCRSLARMWKASRFSVAQGSHQFGLQAYLRMTQLAEIGCAQRLRMSLAMCTSTLICGTLLLWNSILAVHFLVPKVLPTIDRSVSGKPCLRRLRLIGWSGKPGMFAAQS